MNAEKDESFIPDDLIQEILLRLPVKSLVRFKSVSKIWKFIITNPNFTKTHFHSSMTTRHQHLSSSHIIVRKDYSIFTLDFDLDNIINLRDKANEEIKGKFAPIFPSFINPPSHLQAKGFHIIGTSHGLLFVCVRETDRFYLWNPSTNESRLIPSPPISKPFKPSYEIVCGCSYVSSINDYKIMLVVIYCFGATHLLVVHVYSLRENKWREIDRTNSTGISRLDLFTFFTTMNSKEAVVVNDSLHWLARGGEGNRFILRFDMVNEIFERGVELKAELGHVLLGVIEDANELCLCHICKGDCSCSCFVHRVVTRPEILMWVLDDKHNSWKNKFRIRESWNHLENYHRLLRVTGNGKILVFEKSFNSWARRLEGLVIYDGRSENNAFYAQDYSLRCQHDIIYSVVNYVRSLISPNSLL